jgi:protein ImuB
VNLHGSEPAAFFSRDDRYRITACYGPWRTNGCWWSVDDWDIEEWDVLAVRADGASIACLLVRDPANNEWRMEAVYD